ncbi:MAG: 6-bladed beta-propeller [Candidatus Sericytochromatia bacterium]|nr:6-bladed beta-propeller [Candidatus Sericytochromatia bacterium]
MSKTTSLKTFASLALAVGLLSGCGRYQDLPALPAYGGDGLLSPVGGPFNRLPTGTVTGRIVDERTKMGIPDVFVEIQNVQPPVAARTDASGNFVLPNVPQGKQIVVVNRPDYVFLAAQGSIIADVMPNTTVNLPVILLSPAIAAASNAFLTSIGGLVEPYGVAVDNNRSALYAVDRIGYGTVLDRRCEVKKYNLNGGFVRRFGGNKFNLSRGNETGRAFDLFTHLSWSYGIDVDAGGNVYVAETNRNKIVKFSSDGDYITRFGENIKNNFDVSVLNTGQIGVSSSGTSKIVLFDVNLAAASRDFAGTAKNPSVNGGFRGVAVDNANFLYVLDNSGGPGTAVKKFDARSSQPVLQFASNAGAGPGQFRGATDLAIDNRNGDVYVVDSGNNRVQRFDRDGRFVAEFGSAGRGNGQFDRPYGIAIDKEGYIFVADTGNKRIQKFAPGRIFNNGSGFNNSVYYPVK